MTKHNDGLLYIALVLAMGAALLSFPGRSGAALRVAGYFLATESLPDSILAAAALGDVRHLDAPP